MKSKLEKYNTLKKKVEQAQKKSAEADGALKQIMQQLGKDFDCKTIVEAKRLLKKRLKKTSEEIETFGQKVDAFEEKYEDFFDD